MKKLFVLLAVAVLVSGIAFAQDSNNEYSFEEVNGDTNAASGSSGGTSAGKLERFTAELGPGFNFHWTNGIHDDLEDKTVTANTSIGVGVTVNFTNIIGLTLDADFSYGAKLFGVATPSSGYISLTGFNVFLGPVFYLYNNNIFRIPFSVGAHMSYFCDDLWVPELDGNNGLWISRSDTQLGIGFSLGLQFHFASGVYVFSRTNASFDFVRMHSTNGEEAFVKETCLDILPISWNVKPSAGVGIRF